MAPCSDQCDCGKAGIGVRRRSAGRGGQALQKAGSVGWGVETTWGVLPSQAYTEASTHATCPRAKISLLTLPFSVGLARLRLKTAGNDEICPASTVLVVGPERGRWPAAFSESDGLTLNRTPLICVTQEGHLPAAWLNTGSLMDTFPPTLSSNRPAHTPPSPPDCLINQGLTLTLDKATF